MADASRPTLATGSSPDALRANTPGGISPKALVHYRKAELSLRRGELTEAVLQLRLAVVSDPHSAFLRTALAEVEAVVVRK
jgi:Flp pilus assembly protein TadD